MLRCFSILLLITLSSVDLFSQSVEKGLFVSGQITELNLSDSSEKAVRSVPVVVVCDSVIIVDSKSANSGRYQFKLPFGYKYEIRYGGEEYLQKTLIIDATDPSAKTLRRGYRLDLDISLFSSESPAVEEVLEAPFAKGTFPKKSEAIEFDDEYNTKALEELRRALARKSK